MEPLGRTLLRQALPCPTYKPEPAEMRRTRNYRINSKASVSLQALTHRRNEGARPMMMAAAAAGFTGHDPVEITPEDRIALNIESPDPDALMDAIEAHYDREMLCPLGGHQFSAHLSAETAAELVSDSRVSRIRTKKEYKPTLDVAATNIGLRPVGGGARLVTEDGTGVLIGVVDTGFDLSHPAFRDAAGNLRVRRLLDQTKNDKEFSTAQLETGWSNGSNPGADGDGHGTHVAGTAGGTAFNGFEGVAPGAEFLLVKTNMMDIDEAVSWIFSEAGSTPCVVNLSLGGHFGAHDGTSPDERLHAQLVGPGKIVVVAAGNEHEDNIHVGHRFFTEESQTVAFDLHRQPNSAPPFVVLTLWHDQSDTFDLSLVTPDGQSLPLPAIGSAQNLESSLLEVELARKNYDIGTIVQSQIAIECKSAGVPNAILQGWNLGIECTDASVGRLDCWMHNSGFGEFTGQSPLIEAHRTIGMPATGAACIAVASHVSKTDWGSDGGDMTDPRAVVGRASTFSSRGPTRDGRQKPDISAPGEHITAALASGSTLR